MYLDEKYYLDPYFTFFAHNELDKIQRTIKTIGEFYQNFLEIDTLMNFFIKTINKGKHKGG